MTTTSSGERIRGSSDIPLTQEGLASSHQLGIDLAAKGGLSEIHSSNLIRALQTAQALARHTHAPIVSATDQLHPWRLGHLEGQPAEEALPVAHQYMRDMPDVPIEGMGPASTKPGESFNQFKQRVLAYVKPLLQRLQRDPNLKIGLVTHLRDRKLLEAWLAMGAPSNNEVDKASLERPPSTGTGSVDRIFHDPTDGWRMVPHDTKSTGATPGGLYVIRHEQTAWNGGQPDPSPSTSNAS